MPTPQTGQPVIDYAPVDIDYGIPFIRPMKRWRWTCGVCFWVAVAGLFFWPPLALFAAAAAIMSAAFTITYMGRSARVEVGAGYAARHVVLAVLLSALFLFGVWLVPILVESELIKWRLVEESNRART